MLLTSVRLLFLYLLVIGLVELMNTALKNYGQAFLDGQKDSCALGDHGTPEDIAALVAFLASKESRFITGEFQVTYQLVNCILNFLSGQTVSKSIDCVDCKLVNILTLFR